MHVEVHDSVEELRRRMRRERVAKRAQRLRIVVLAMEGRTAREIAQRIDLSDRQVQHWVWRYNQTGALGLEDRAGRGPAPMLIPEEAQRLLARLDAKPLPDDHVCSLRGKDVQRILEQEFGKRRTLGAVYKLLHQLGYSSLAPRPQHRKANLQAQEAFKKTFPRLLPRYAEHTPTARCKSSSKTKPALASRGL